MYSKEAVGDSVLLRFTFAIGIRFLQQSSYKTRVSSLFSNYTKYFSIGIKPGLHYQSFCGHSRNFAYGSSKFERICTKSLRDLILSI